MRNSSTEWLYLAPAGLSPAWVSAHRVHDRAFTHHLIASRLPALQACAPGPGIKGRHHHHEFRRLRAPLVPEPVFNSTPNSDMLPQRATRRWATSTAKRIRRGDAGCIHVSALSPERTRHALASRSSTDLARAVSAPSPRHIDSQLVPLPCAAQAALFELAGVRPLVDAASAVLNAQRKLSADAGRRMRGLGSELAPAL